MTTPFVLASNGCDRATAYHMSNKVIRHPHGTFVTWLDDQYRAVLAQVEPATGKVLRSFPLAQGVDNHCGAAMAMTPDHRLHITTGAHATGSFIYRYSDTPADPASWSLPLGVGVAPTYPSLVARPDGGLLLAHRAAVHGGRWGVTVHTRSPEGRWAWPLKLMHAASDNYIFPTNSLTVDADGVTHMVIEFYKTYPPDTEAPKSVAVTHVYSPDGGVQWFHDDDRPVSAAPFGIEDAVLIAHDPAGNSRPANLAFLPDGRAAICVWNARDGRLTLYVREAPGTWSSTELATDALAIRPGWRVNSHGRLAIDVDGSLAVVTTIAPGLDWSHAEQHVRCLWLDPSSRTVTRRFLVPKERPERAAWLPAIEHGHVGLPDEPLLLLYTDGSRGKGCVNDATCNIRMLELAPDLQD